MYAVTDQWQHSRLHFHSINFQMQGLAFNRSIIHSNASIQQSLNSSAALFNIGTSETTASLVYLSKHLFEYSVFATVSSVLCVSKKRFVLLRDSLANWRFRMFVVQ